MRPVLTLLFCCCLLVPVSAEAQFLSRDTRALWANEVFENYGANGYRDYDFEEENRRFDIFGDLLIDGVDILEYSEVRRDAPGQIGSYQAVTDGYNDFFQKLVIANEGFGSWSTRLIFGDHLRTSFTPMTLNLPNFNGIRWDGSSRKSRFSLIATHLKDPLVFNPVDLQERRVFGTGLVGGHWESQVGDLLKIGTTYVNTHRFDAEASSNINGLKGDVPGVIQEGGLRRVFVFFTDDAPHDAASGATIYELTMFVDGEAVTELRVGKIDRILDHITVTADRSNTVPLTPTDVQYLRRNGPWLRAVVEASNTNFFPIVLGRITQPSAPASTSAPLVATGTDVVFYEYEVPEGAKDVRFEAILANDYSVDVVGGMQVPLFDSGTDYGDIFYDWNNTLRAKGTPGSDANVRRVSFRYGFPTGLGILGLNFRAQILGSSLQGEYARSTRFLKMPSTGGSRHERGSSTFYVNFQKSTERGEVGFEWFDVPDDYTTDFSLFEASSLGFPVGGHTYNRFALVEDNDDLDAWPDWTEHGDPLGFFSRSTNEGYGVFPGLDLNQDGRLDLNVGGNAHTPFLGYYVDPPELVYGDDFNNNGVVDLRENDNLPDYLYPLDHRGLHGFVSIKPTTRSQVRLGAYRMDQPTLGPSSDATYMEGEYKRTWEGIGDIRLVHRTKWLKDNIQNTVYQFIDVEALPTGLTRPARYELKADLLQDRDSVDNLTHIEIDLKTVPDLNIRNILTSNHIDLSGPTSDDPLVAAPGTITHFSMVNKADYTWHWKKFQLISQFKHIYQRSKFPEREIADRQTRWIIPILRMEYPISANTILKTGMQGLPFFAERSLDITSPERDFHRRTHTAFLQNRSNHRGYDLTLLFGGYRSFTNFSGSQRPSLGYVEYFFKVFIG